MQSKETDKRTIAIHEMIEQLLLVKFELEASIILVDQYMASFQNSLRKNKKSSESCFIRKGIDFLIEKKSVSERDINALNNNIEYYSSMLTRQKSKS